MLVATAIMGCALAYEIAPELAPAAGLTSGLLALRAYPSNPAARKAIRPQAKCRKAR
jgi:hypothetical protein